MHEVALADGTVMPALGLARACVRHCIALGAYSPLER